MDRRMWIASAIVTLTIMGASLLVAMENRQERRLIASGACRAMARVPASIWPVTVCLSSNPQGHCTMLTTRESFHAETYWVCETGRTFWRVTEH